MLLLRIFTAIPLALVVIWLILFQPTDGFVYLLYLVSVIAGFEWGRLSGCKNKWANAAYASLVTMMSVLLILKAAYAIEWLIYGSVLFWLAITLKIRTMRSLKRIEKKPDETSTIKLVIGALVISSAVLAMWSVHRSENGAYWLMYGLALVWVADIGAYFSGKKFGKNKLAESISPGKTIEGLCGALVLTSLYTLIAGYYFDLNGSQTISLLLISLLLTVVSVVGDLYESTLKREMGLKDSGNILPGHGGILDRIDGVLSVMPVYSVALHYLLIHSVYGN